jgi:small subunit ribosomal protein S20
MLKTCKTFIKNLKKTSDKNEYSVILNEAVSKLDKLAKKRIIHPNKAANAKSKLYSRMNKMVAA